MMDWIKRRELEISVKTIFRILRDKCNLSENINKGIKSAIVIMDSLPSRSLDVTILIGRLIYLLRERIVNKDLKFFQTDLFKISVNKVLSQSDLLDNTMKESIANAFKQAFSGEDAISAFNVPLTVKYNLKKEIDKIIELFPYVVREYQNSGLEMPYSRKIVN
jgi:hypothetical protein